VLNLNGFVVVINSLVIFAAVFIFIASVKVYDCQFRINLSCQTGFNLNSFGIIVYGYYIVTFFEIYNPPVKIRISIIRFKLNGSGVIINGLIKFVFIPVCNTSVNICISQVWLYLNGFGVIVDSLFIVTFI